MINANGAGLSNANLSNDIKRVKLLIESYPFAEPLLKETYISHICNAMHTILNSHAIPTTQQDAVSTLVMQVDNFGNSIGVDFTQVKTWLRTNIIPEDVGPVLV